MTWLKSFGLEAVKFIGVVLSVLSGGGVQAIEGAYPSTVGPITTFTDYLTEIENIITSIESGVANAQAGGMIPTGAAGALKLALATPAVANVLAKQAVAQGIKFSNPAAFKAAAIAQVNATVAKLNSQSGSPKTTSVTG